MKINFNKLTKVVLIFSLLLVAFSFFYYYVIFLPQKEEARLEQQRQEELAEQKKEAEMREKLNSCLRVADISYSLCWDSHCEVLGREENCELPFSRIDRCKEQRKQDKDYCFKRYPVK